MNYDEQELLNDLISNFKLCDHADVNGFTFSIESGGSKGGNCYGDYSTQFRNSSSDMIDSIQEQIISGTENYFSMLQICLSTDELRQKTYTLAENIVDNPYNTKNEHEFYGNHSEYNQYFVSIVEVLDFLDDTISNIDKEKIISIADVAQNHVFSENLYNNQYALLKETEKNIANFTKTSDNEEKQLQSSLDNAKKEVINITQKLTVLEKKQLSQLNQLKKTRDNIIEFLGEDYIQSKEVKTKKYGY